MALGQKHCKKIMNSLPAAYVVCRKVRRRAALEKQLKL